MMSLSTYDISVPVYLQYLGALSNVLGKAAAHAEDKKIDLAFLLGMRLYPDMYTLTQQVQQATSYAINGAGRSADVARPDLGGGETTFAALQARIATAIDFLNSLKPESFNSRDVTIPFHGRDRKFTGRAYLTTFSLPNFFFHCAMAYGILRHCGVEIGISDFRGTPILPEDEY
jgi:uncharacterized protein